MDYLDLKGCHHLVEVLQQFDRKTIRNFSNSYMTKDNKIDEQKIIEAIKITTSLPQIKEEYFNIFPQLKNLREQRENYLSENKLLINKNLELQDDLILTQNKTKEYITDLLKQKDSYIRSSIKTILKIIKEDPEKEILFSNNLRSSDQKISEVVTKFRDGISETIVDSITNPNPNYYYDKNNSF